MNHDPSAKPGLSYRDAGVDIDAGDQLVENIKPFAKRTLREGVLAGIGGFGALFEVPETLPPAGAGFGHRRRGHQAETGLRARPSRHVGIDLVAMSVNDVLVQGAEPLFFLDYFACGHLDVATATDVIKGVALGCEQAGCALIGGETAEMPGMYPQGEYDLAGFAVGVVEKDKIIDGVRIAPGDAVLGLASSGPHSNGYSLIRRILERSRADLAADFHGRALGEALLAPTRIYVKPLLALMRELDVKGLAHITGGGLLENVPRVLPAHTVAELDRNAWPRPPLFDWLQQTGGVAEQEMFRVFNCGIGMIVIVSEADAQRALQSLTAAGETAWRIGRIRARAGDEAQTRIA